MTQSNAQPLLTAGQSQLNILAAHYRSLKMSSNIYLPLTPAMVESDVVRAEQ